MMLGRSFVLCFLSIFQYLYTFKQAPMDYYQSKFIVHSKQNQLKSIQKMLASLLQYLYEDQQHRDMILNLDIVNEQYKHFIFASIHQVYYICRILVHLRKLKNSYTFYFIRIQQNQLFLYRILNHQLQQQITMMNLQLENIGSNSKKCGCYVSDADFLKDYPGKFVLVPLKTSEYNVQIVNSIANVSLLQTYLNPTQKYLQFEYSFPINPNACIYRFVATFGNQRIQGVVKEKQEAKIQYKQAVKQGKKAAYGEINAQSKDILTIRVGNVAPQNQVKIQLEYLQELTLSCNTFYQLHMMGTISPRYMNYISEEAIHNALRNDKARSEGLFYWNFKITLKTTRKVPFFDSNSHDIELISQNDTKTESIFAMSKSSVPNKDFIFSYTTQDYELPSYVFGRTDVGSTAMISFIPKFCTLNIDDAYKASVSGKGFETDIQNAKGQYVFLLDRSGSMSGARINKAKQALILFIKSLPQDTYFNVISFGDQGSPMFPKSVKYNNNQVKYAISQIQKMSADMGGTQIYQPLQRLITQKPLDGYPKQIFLLTDGGVSNTEGVIKMVSRNNKYSRVHTIGIGNGCSQQLILGCAKNGKGYHVFITDQQDPSQKIIQLLTDSLSPVISKMKLIYDKNLVQSIIPNPENLPYVLKNQLVNFFITFKGQLDKVANFEFSYEDSLNKKPYKSDITVDPSSQSSSFIDRMGHFKKIRLLEESFRDNSNIEQLMFYVKTVDKKAQIIKQSVKHQILSEFTAFICTQKVLLDGKYQEIKEIGKVKIQIINPPPIQYDLQHNLFGISIKRSIIPPQIKSYALSGSPVMCQKANMVSKDVKKQKSSGGFFDSIKSFFTGNSITSTVQSSPPPSYQQQCMKKQQLQFTNECCQIDYQQEKDFPKKANYQCQEQDSYHDEACFDLRQLDRQLGSNKNNKQVEAIKIPESLSISQLISYQTTEGSWNEVELIGKLFGKDIEKTIASQNNLAAVITYLVSKWIEKHHPQKQYSLVVKKGLNFAKKNAANFDKFSQLYDHLVK